MELRELFPVPGRQSPAPITGLGKQLVQAGCAVLFSGPECLTRQFRPASAEIQLISSLDERCVNLLQPDFRTDPCGVRRQNLQAPLPREIQLAEIRERLRHFALGHPHFAARMINDEALRV